MEKLRRFLGGAEQEEQERQTEEGGFTEIMDSNQFGLSYSTRIKGFIACLLIGFLFSIFGGICLFFLNYRGFAIMYTFGSIVGLSSTLFLMGPMKQLQRMFATTRIIATIVMIIALIMTLLCALKWHKTGLALIFVVIQFLAMTWYSLSYIPYARDAVKKMLSGIF